MLKQVHNEFTTNLELNLSEPLLSVVTVNLNNAQGLKRTLNSFSQFSNDPSVEFIFIDGASKDGSVEIAQAFYSKDKLISERDNGIYDAMNKGLYRSTGRYVVWMNSGDCFVEGVWPELREVLSHSHALMIACDLYVSSEEGDSVELKKNTASRIRKLGLWHQSVFFNRERVIYFGGYSNKYKILGDRELITKMYLAGDLVEYPGLVSSVFYTGGVSANSYGLFADHLKIDLHYGLINIAQYVCLYFRYVFYAFIVCPTWTFLKKHTFFKKGGLIAKLAGRIIGEPKR